MTSSWFVISAHLESFHKKPIMRFCSRGTLWYITIGNCRIGLYSIIIYLLEDIYCNTLLLNYPLCGSCLCYVPVRTNYLSHLLPDCVHNSNVCWGKIWNWSQCLTPVLLNMFEGAIKYISIFFHFETLSCCGYHNSCLMLVMAWRHKETEHQQVWYCPSYLYISIWAKEGLDKYRTEIWYMIALRDLNNV